MQIWCHTNTAGTQAVLHCGEQHDHGSVFDLVECTVVDPLRFEHVLFDQPMMMYDWSADPFFTYPDKFDFRSTPMLRGGVHTVRWRARCRR